MAGIVANLDDLQSGIEACARTVDALHVAAARFDDILTCVKDAPRVRSLVTRIADLQACARDQRGAIRELRDGFARLREDLMRRENRAAHTPHITKRTHANGDIDRTNGRSRSGA